MSVSQQKPARYVVYYEDAETNAALAKRLQCEPEDVHPALCEVAVDCAELTAARQLADQRSGYVEERINLRRVEDPPLWWWDWDQERVD